MEVGFDAKRYFLNRTGLGDYSRNLIKHLHSLHPEVKIHLFSPKLSYIPLLEGVVTHTPQKSAFLWRQRGMTQDIYQSGVDIFHGLSAELPGNLTEKKVAKVVTIHDLLFMRFPEYYSALDRQIYNWKTRTACKKADAIITISQATSIDLQEKFKVSHERIHVIPPIGSFRPILNPSISRKQTDSSPILLCVSSFTHRKNLERLIDAFLKADGAFRLVIAGKSGETRGSIQRKIKNIPISKVELMFDVSESTLSQLWNEASAFIYPSLAEGFGMPVLDAMHFGIPVITSKASSMEEICGHAGIYFEAASIESIQSAIEKCWKELPKFKEEHYQQLLAGRLEQFSAGKSTASLFSLYSSLL